jgi:H+-transporting ATPase
MATHTDPPKTPDTKPGAKPVAKDDLQKLPIAEVEKRLSSSPDGLSEAEAKKRLTQYGPNEIAEKKANALLKFLGYFWGPIPWMIEVAFATGPTSSSFSSCSSPMRPSASGKNARLAMRSTP